MMNSKKMEKTISKGWMEGQRKRKRENVQVVDGVGGGGVLFVRAWAVRWMVRKNWDVFGKHDMNGSDVG